MSYEDFIPGCKIDPEKNVIVCDAKKLIKDKVITGSRPIILTVENGKIYTLDEGDTPEKLLKEVKKHVVEGLRARG